MIKRYFKLFRFLTILTVLIYLYTEILSAFRLINRFTVVGFWLVILIFLIFYMKKRGGYTNLLCDLRNSFSFKQTPIKIIVLFMGGMAIVYALLTIPYNYDSMTYHLSRIAFWEQNCSIAHYPTHTIRQISSPVLAEIINLHVYILTGHFLSALNLLQTISYLLIALSIFGVCYILDVYSKYSYISVILFMTMPIAFAESISTQNDLVAGVIFAAFIAELIFFLKSNAQISLKKDTIISVISMGALLALSYLAKPSVTIGIIVILCCTAILLIIRHDNIQAILILVVIAGLVAAALVFPEIIRNFQSFGKINDESVSGNVMIRTSDIRFLIVNFLKNEFYNLPFNEFTGSIFMFLLQGLSSVFNINLDDEVISFGGLEYVFIPPTNMHHDFAINPLVEWTILVGIIILIFLNIRKHISTGKLRAFYIVATSSSFTIFCLILKWQIWGTRLMLPYLAILCPLLGIVLDEIAHFFTKWKMKTVSGVIILLALVGWVTSLVFHSHYLGLDKPVYRLYSSCRQRYGDDQMIADRIIEDGYKNVGLISREDDYSFNWFVMLDSMVEEIYYVNVYNNSASISEYESPDCIIVRGDEIGDELECGGEMYEPVLKREMIVLFKKVTN